MGETGKPNLMENYNVNECNLLFDVETIVETASVETIFLYLKVWVEVVSRWK